MALRNLILDDFYKNWPTTILTNFLLKQFTGFLHNDQKHDV